MKKNIFILVASLMLTTICGCDLSNSDSTSLIDTSSDSFEFDEENYEKETFVSVDELYMNVNETYNLSLMGKNTLGLNYLSSNPNCLSVSEDGVLTAISNNNEECLSAFVYLYTDSKCQKVAVNIVDYSTYGTALTSIDVGRLTGKNVVFFGDSITHNWIKYPAGDKSVINDTTSLGYDGHYVVELNKKCKFASVTNAAWSGGTMSYLPSSPERFTYKSFPVSVNDNIEAIKKSDYIFVFYGTNDLTDQVKVGNMTDVAVIDEKTTSTFAGGMNYGINTIRSVKPDANIIFLNIAYRTYPYVGKYSINDYNDMIFNICRANLIKHIDVYNMYDTKYSSTYLNSDGLHFSNEGYKVLTDYLLNDGKRAN